MKRENIAFEDLDQKQVNLYQEAYNKQLELLEHNDKVMANDIEKLKANGFVEGEHFRTIYYTDETLSLEIYDSEFDTCYKVRTITKLSALATIKDYAFIFYQLSYEDGSVYEQPVNSYSLSMSSYDGKLKFRSSYIMGTRRWYTSKKFIEQLVYSKQLAERQAYVKARKKMLNDYGEAYLKIKYPNSKFLHARSGWCVEFKNGLKVYFSPPHYEGEENPKPRLEKVEVPYSGLEDDDKMLNLLYNY